MPQPETQMPRTSVVLEHDQLAALRRIAEEQDRSLAYMVRKAVSLFLLQNISDDSMPTVHTDQREAA